MEGTRDGIYTPAFSSSLTTQKQKYGKSWPFESISKYGAHGTTNGALNPVHMHTPGTLPLLVARTLCVFLTIFKDWLESFRPRI